MSLRLKGVRANTFLPDRKVLRHEERITWTQELLGHRGRLRDLTESTDCDQFCKSLSWNLLHRWFLGMTMDEPDFVASTFSKNQQRLLEHDVAPRFFAEVVRQARVEHLLSEEHFTVDVTLVESLASLKSVRRKDDDDGGPIAPDNQGVDFHGDRRSNATHASITDPEAGCSVRAGQRPRSFTSRAMR